MESKHAGDGVAADHANECWEPALTQYGLPRDVRAEILAWFDDSGYALSVTVHDRVTGLIELAAFRAACAEHGLPTSVVTDKGMLSRARLTDSRRADRGSPVGELRRLGIVRQGFDARRPRCKGMAERFLHGLLRGLAAQNPEPASLTGLQALLDTLTAGYNHHHASRRHQGHVDPRQQQARRFEHHLPAAAGRAAAPRRPNKPRPAAGGSA